MSKSNYSRGSSSVDDWLENQYEYIVPEKDVDNPYPPRDAARDITPEHSNSSPPGSKGSRSKHHRSSKDRYRPVTPPEEDDLDKERDRHRHKGKSSRSHDGDRETRRSHQDRDSKYPPKADRGRPRRPPMDNRATSHYVSRKEDSPERRHRRYSLSSSPPRHRGDKSSRHYSSRHHEDRSPSPPPRSSRKKDDREKESRGHHHHSSSGSTKGTKSRRPSVSHSQTSKDPKRPSGSGRSLSFWNDPRFMTAAEAALTAGASAAVGLAGEKGAWGGDKGGKVLRAGLGAAALSALKGPATAAPPPPEPAPAPAPAAGPPEPRSKAADAAGRYVAEHLGGRKSSTRRRHR